ncbi:hypothetical protein Poli38472_012736 [Pythium oligandrum]|uniref:Uncharacterized protein n=1 Tax=Pythium oligandrum TaxID=41045 RepID=A0A8K1FFD9_PYTOL|nr:hypothetical protein Poli38472_012736 [Pythium oligandrum]|eukprot:TMW61545.1 hypothetical protein Poli38472_012736 [Pythium oligandrum]
MTVQEATFACFEDDESELGVAHGVFQARLLPTHAIAAPVGFQTLPSRSGSRLHTLESTGSGTFFFQNDALKHRFLCWRIVKNTVIFRESSLHETLHQNAIRLKFPAPVVTKGGVAAFEAWDAHAVVLSVLTHAGTIHRLTFAVPVAAKSTASTGAASIFANEETLALAASTSSVFPRKPAFHVATTVVNSLQADEAITTALWVNEYNLIVSTDSGRIIGVNFGLPSAPEQTPQEFLFSDESMVRWIWNGLVKTSGVRRRTGNGDDLAGLSRDAIIAMTFFPLDNSNSENEEDEDDNGEIEDVCVLTLSADFTLRAWSFRSQVCLGKQSIRYLVRASEEDDNMSNDDDDDSEAFATQAKLMAIPSSTSGASRILVHVDSTDEYPQQLVLLRGDISTSGTHDDLGLEVSRVFSVGQGNRLKFVDFAIEKGFLYSAWRSTSGDFVYSHENPMALTGPRLIAGQLIGSGDVQMKKYEAEDLELPVQLGEQGVEGAIDNFYAERVLLPGRFSRHSLYKAISELHSGVDAPVRAYFTQAGPQESRFKELLVNVVSDKWLQSAGKQHPRWSVHDAQQARVEIWKSIVALCTKHWRNEVAPIGFAVAPSTLTLGSPVLLRRNRLSLFFPSAASIVSNMLTKTVGSNRDHVRDIVADVLPAYDAFPSHSFQSSIQNEVSVMSSDWKVESLIALARQSVRLSMRAEPSIAGVQRPDLVLTRALLRLSRILGEGDAHVQVLQDLVDGLAPSDPATSAEDPFASENSNGVMDDDEDDQMNGETNTRGQYFGGNEISFAFSQASARTVDELCAQSLRVVLCLAHLVDAMPTFMTSTTLKAVERTILPKAIIVYQRWSLSRWFANQNISSTTELDIVTAKAFGTVLPPLLQSFLVETSASLNHVETFQRARAVAEMRDLDPYESEDPHKLLASYIGGILELVSRPNDRLVTFLQKKKEFSILRSMLSCTLTDLSLQDADGQAQATMHKYIRSIGECLAWEGHQAARNDAKEEAAWCLKQSIRCFNMCLSSFCAQVESSQNDDAMEVCEQFISDSVSLLKETVPAGFYDLTLSFLWVIASEALKLVSSKSLQSFVWVNIFKYSVEEHQYHDAHLALMRTVSLSSLAAPSFDEDGNAHDEEAAAISRTAVECTSYFVKELCRHGRLDLICDFQWGVLESEVEEQIQWLAANANVLKDGCVDPTLVMFHQLVYAFFVRRNQPANAAAGMHNLFLRLRFAPTKSAVSLKTQRNALMAAFNILMKLDEENRWVVRKLNPEDVASGKLSAKQVASLSIVTYKDIERDLAVLDGKLHLLELGQEESLLLSSMGAPEIVALLIDSALSRGEVERPGTASEKQQESLVLLELAVQIASKASLGYEQITRSIARYCVSNVSKIGIDSLAWELLKTYLRFVDELEQYEIAAETILSWRVKVVLPEWITRRLTCPRTGNASKLVLRYLQHGLLIEASTVAAAMIPMDVLNEDETQFRKRASSSSMPLPFLPYNLFDAVLNASDAALSTRGFAADPGDTALRSATQKLRDHLVKYFRYVDTLQQARGAANASKNASNGW